MGKDYPQDNINTRNKYHRRERTYLDGNHVTSEAWFDEAGQPLTMGDTYVRVEREFDANGNIAVERYYGADGSPIARKDGYDEIRQVYNDQNKPVRSQYFLCGEPFLFAGEYAAIEREYDDRGNVIVERYYGTNGKQCTLKYYKVTLKQKRNLQAIRQSTIRCHLP